jgi:hypothetical protein
MLDRHPRAVLASTTPAFRVGGHARPAASRLVSAVPGIFFCNHVGYPTSVGIRRAALNDIGGFDEGLEVGEDGELFLRLALRGPFVTLQRRTIVHQHTAGSLIERGGRRAAFVRAWRTMAEQARDAAGKEGAFAEQAAASVTYVEGLVALLEGEPERARKYFAEAKAAWPQLSRLPMMILKRVENVLWEPHERLRAFAIGAAVWPDPDSETALFLRVRAVALALRLGRLGLAARLARDWPLRRTPTFARRTRRTWVWLARRYVQSRVYRGAESDALASSSSRSRCSSWAIRSSSSS